MFLKSILVTGVLMMAAASINAAPKTFFPLMAWDYVDDEATLKAMADCEINMVAFVPPKLLDACQKYGIKAILYDERLGMKRWDQPYDGESACKAIPEIIKKYNDHPAVFGYHLKDEPDAGQFAALGKASALVKKLAPGKWPYVNMTPGMGDGYVEFLEQYVKACDPPILSYDNYAIGEGGGFSYGYWANIHDIRSVAMKHKIPFYNIVLTVAHWGYREPTAADIRLQIYGSLVYGARGVCFYKFCSCELAILDAPDLGNWRMAPLDQFGEKTSTWYDLRNTNRQVLNLAPTLLKLRSDDVYHVGEIPERNHGMSDKTLVKGLTSGEAFVIGDFTHEDGSRWVMIVNKHLQHSAFVRPEFNITVKSLKYLSPVTGELKDFPSPWYCIAPGQGVLLKLVTD